MACVGLMLLRMAGPAATEKSVPCTTSAPVVTATLRPPSWAIGSITRFTVACAESTICMLLEKKAEERLKFRKAQLEMMESLFTRNMVSRKEYVDAQEDVAVRSKELDEARGRLKVLLAGSRPEEIEAIEAELARLKAQRAYVEEQLQRVRIISPMAGVIR